MIGIAIQLYACAHIKRLIWRHNFDLFLMTKFWCQVAHLYHKMKKSPELVPVHLNTMFFTLSRTVTLVLDEGHYLQLHPFWRLGCRLLCWYVFKGYRIRATTAAQAAWRVWPGLEACQIKYSTTRRTSLGTMTCSKLLSHLSMQWRNWTWNVALMYERCQMTSKLGKRFCCLHSTIYRQIYGTISVFSGERHLSKYPDTSLAFAAGDIRRPVLARCRLQRIWWWKEYIKSFSWQQWM